MKAAAAFSFAVLALCLVVAPALSYKLGPSDVDAEQEQSSALLAMQRVEAATLKRELIAEKVCKELHPNSCPVWHSADSMECTTRRGVVAVAL